MLPPRVPFLGGPVTPCSACGPGPTARCVEAAQVPAQAASRWDGRCCRDPVVRPRRRRSPPVRSVAPGHIVRSGGGPPGTRRALGRRGMSSRLGGASGSPSAPAPPYRPRRAGGSLSTWSTPSRRCRAGVFRRPCITASDRSARYVRPGRRGVPVGSIVAGDTQHALGQMSQTFGTFVRRDHHPMQVRCRVTNGKNRDGPMRGQQGAG